MTQAETIFVLEQRRLLVKAHTLTHSVREDYINLGADNHVKQNAKKAIHLLNQFLRNEEKQT